MRHLLILTSLFLGSITSAEARDSAWLLCENGSLVINALEHRAGDSMRSTSYALIFGARILKGELPESKTEVRLSESAETPDLSAFKGTIVMADDLSSVTIQGRLMLDGSLYSMLNETLPCKRMSNDEI